MRAFIISRYEKRINEAARELRTFTHMRNGDQVDESARRGHRTRRFARDVIDRQLGSSSSLGGLCG